MTKAGEKYTFYFENMDVRHNEPKQNGVFNIDWFRIEQKGFF